MGRQTIARLAWPKAVGKRRSRRRQDLRQCGSGGHSISEEENIGERCASNPAAFPHPSSPSFSRLLCQWSVGLGRIWRGWRRPFKAPAAGAHRSRAPLIIAAGVGLNPFAQTLSRAKFPHNNSNTAIPAPTNQQNPNNPLSQMSAPSTSHQPPTEAAANPPMSSPIKLGAPKLANIFAAAGRSGCGVG